MADKTPLFWQRIERGGGRVFRLCPRGERIKLCGRAAGWRRELLGYAIMSILPPVVPRICTAPVTPKESPGLAIGSSSGSAFSLGSRAASHLPQNPKSGWLQKKDDSKTYILWGYRFCLRSGISFPSPLSHLDVFFCAQVYSDSGRAGAMSRTRDGETEMSVQSRVRLLNGSRRLAEVSVFPSVPCLRRSVSAPEIPCLRRQTPCPQATATLAWGEHAGNTSGLQLVFSALLTSQAGVGASQ